MERGRAEGLGLGLEMVEERYVGTPLDGHWCKALGGRNHARSRGHFGILPRLAFERQSDGDFADVPVGSVEYFQLQAFVLNGTGAVELEQFGERQIFDENRLDQQRAGPGVERETAGYIR